MMHAIGRASDIVDVYVGWLMAIGEANEEILHTYSL